MSLHNRTLAAASATLAAFIALAAPVAAQRDRPTTERNSRQAQPRGDYGQQRSNQGRDRRDVRQRVFSQPYYSFRPRFSVGFGISVGHGVAYPFRYYDPSGFYNHSVRVVPGYGPGRYNSGYYNRVGGLSFDIDPYDADVFIDGEYVGVAEDFSSYQMPLTLPIGRHRVDLRSRGFRTASFQITIVGGQVVPYAGRMAFLR